MKLLSIVPNFNKKSPFLWNETPNGIENNKASIVQKLDTPTFNKGEQEFDEFQDIINTTAVGLKLTDGKKQEFYNKVLDDLTNYSRLDKNEDMQVSQLEINQYQEELNEKILQILTKSNLDVKNFNIKNTVNKIIDKIITEDINVEWDDDEAFYVNNDGDLMINKNWSINNAVLYKKEAFASLKTTPNDVAQYLNSHKNEIKAHIGKPKDASTRITSATKSKESQAPQSELISKEERINMENVAKEVVLPSGTEALTAKGTRPDGQRYIGKRIYKEGKPLGSLWFYPDKPEGEQFGFSTGETLSAAFVPKDIATNGLINVLYPNSFELVANSPKTEKRNAANKAFLENLTMGDIQNLEIKIDPSETEEAKVLKIQKKLIEEGYSISSTGNPDGWAGKKTTDALSEYNNHLLVAQNKEPVRIKTKPRDPVPILTSNSQEKLKTREIITPKQTRENFINSLVEDMVSSDNYENATTKYVNGTKEWLKSKGLNNEEIESALNQSKVLHKEILLAETKKKSTNWNDKPYA